MNERASAVDWQRRYALQAGWTRQIRAYLLARAGAGRAARVLDVGCGPGALLGELAASAPQASITGIDFDGAALQLAMRSFSAARLAQADAHRLPFPNACFDIVFCHFLLLWLAHPLQALSEMARITRRGGWVIACAEPDYGARLDHPTALAEIGLWQTLALQRQRADPLFGRRLRELCHRAGLQSIESGILGSQWSPGLDEAAFESEWEVIASDLTWLPEIPPTRVARLQEIDKNARLSGERVLFVPTFYAIGRAA